MFLLAGPPFRISSLVSTAIRWWGGAPSRGRQDGHGLLTWCFQANFDINRHSGDSGLGLEIKHRLIGRGRGHGQWRTALPHRDLRGAGEAVATVR
jgi:hypothetical protein